MTCRKVTIAELRKTVPRAAELAVIAAVDAIADQRPQFDRDRAGKLDRQVGNAASSVNFVGGDDGFGRAGVKAALASAAVLVDRLVGG